jgi:hypothetical protein
MFVICKPADQAAHLGLHLLQALPERGGTYVDPTTGLTVTWKLVNFTGSGTLSRK